MKILGYEYSVDISKREDELGYLGLYTGKLLIIEIAKEMNIQQTQSTVIHEIIEAINFHLRLSLPHQTIAGLETGIFQTLVDNGVDLSPLLKDAIQDPQKYIATKAK
jgi:hypothetical protein